MVKSPDKVIAAFNESSQLGNKALRSSAGWTRDYRNLAPNVSGKPGLTSEDYDYFRPDEMISGNSKDVFLRADKYYEEVGIVKNIIDLMGDFTCQGIRVVHRNKRKQRIYEYWWKNIVNGPAVSERFCNLLYRLGTAVIQMHTAKLPSKALNKATAAVDRQGLPADYKPEKNEIPFKYTFHHPYYVQIMGGSLASFADKHLYAIDLPQTLRNQIKMAITKEDKEVLATLPDAVQIAANSNQPYVLPEGKVFAYHYKKDDWRQWARPIIYSIMDDLEMLNKLKLADKCALDGATSHIRIFKLGKYNESNPAASIAPTKAAFDKLSGILQNNVGGGNIDIIWDPNIEIEETKSDSYNYLGDEKYKATMQRIYEGLGVPPSLTGTMGATGTTNNFVSLKTLTERLEYGRGILMAFWNAQLALMQKALGDRFAAQIEFDEPVLANEDAEKKVLLDMRDRGLISDELLQRRLGIDPNMENIRLNREERERKQGQRIMKTGQWFPQDPENELKKIALQSGQATPSQVGLELEEKKSGEKKMMDIKPPPGAAGPPQTKKPKKSNGRPKLSKDKTKRKQKKVKPRTSATYELWAKEAQKAIAEQVNPIILDRFNKKNMRSLSEDEYKLSEDIKFGVLSNIEPFSVLSEDNIGRCLSTNFSDDIYAELNDCIAFYVKNMNKEPTVDEVRDIQTKIVANRWLNMENYNGES